MNKWIFRLIICVVLIFSVAALTACSNEAEALQEQIDILEAENNDLHSVIASLRTDLDRSQANLSNAQNELLILIAKIEEEAAQQNRVDEELAITYRGSANRDMSWPLSYGDLPLGVRVNLDDLGEDDEITWRTTDESVITIVPGDDGTTATVTPVAVGSARVVVTVGEETTSSWVRIT